MKVIHEGDLPFLPSAMRCSRKTDGAGEGTGMLIHFTLGLSPFAGQIIHSGLASSTRKPEKGRAKKRNSLGQNFNCQAESLCVGWILFSLGPMGYYSTQSFPKKRQTRLPQQLSCLPSARGLVSGLLELNIF